MTRHETVADFCAWLRAESARCLRLADEVERTLSGHSTEVPPQQPESDNGRERLIDRAHAVMGTMAMRRRTLAERLGVTLDEVESILSTSNGFVESKRGWWKVSNGVSHE